MQTHWSSDIEMSQNNPRPFHGPPKSDRVLQLLAASIRTAVRLRYGRNLSEPDSIDLARVHDLPGAMKAIAAKLELHHNVLGDSQRFKLAVNEAMLASTGKLGTERIIAMREASQALAHPAHTSSSEAYLLAVALRTVEEEANLWAKAYARFLTEIERLYRSRSVRIFELRLPADGCLEAQAELAKIIGDAIQRVGQLVSSR